jgi:hypothetical protein
MAGRDPEARIEDEDCGYERPARAEVKSAGLAPGAVVANCVRDLEDFSTARRCMRIRP